MRTTFTLEPDVAARLDRIRRRTHASLKALVDAALRAGLPSLEDRRRAGDEYTIRPLKSGPCLLPSLDDVSEVSSAGEGEDYK